MCNDPTYLLFAGDYYYPSGGMGDLVDSFQTVANAKMHAKEVGYDWWHIVDQSSMKIVTDSYREKK